MVIAMDRSRPLVRFLFFACLALIVPACDETPSQEETAEQAETSFAGFEAAITGAYQGEASGAGVLEFLPEAGFEHQGYFFLSDGQGIRPHGVTFVLPRELGPGKHRLESPSPLDIGTVPSVRVDRDMGQSVLSSETNTSGFLDLVAFPDDENSLSGSDVVGSFEFETEDPQGRKIGVKGKFSFKVE